MKKSVQICPPIQSFDEICRACLKKSHKLYPIKGITFSDSPPNSDVENIVTISSVFEKYCSIKIYEKDKMPQKMCHSCLELAYNSYDFFEMFWHSQQLLTKILQVSLNNLEKKVKRESLQADSKLENVRKDDEDILDNDKACNSEIGRNQNIEKVISTGNTQYQGKNLDYGHLSIIPETEDQFFLLEKNLFFDRAAANNGISEDKEGIASVCNMDEKHNKQPLPEALDHKSTPTTRETIVNDQFYKENNIFNKATFDHEINKSESQIQKLYIRNAKPQPKFSECERASTILETMIEERFNDKASADREINKDEPEIKKNCNMNTTEPQPTILEYKCLPITSKTVSKSKFFPLKLVNQVQNEGKILTDLTQEEDKRNKHISNHFKNTNDTIIGNLLGKVVNPAENIHYATKGINQVIKKTNYYENKTALTNNKQTEENTNRIQDIIQAKTIKECLQKLKKPFSRGYGKILKNIYHDHPYCDHVETTNIQKFFCRFCSIMFYNIGQVMAHIKNCHNKLMKCIICYSGLFKSRKLLVFHIAKHSHKSLICGKCKLYFSDEHLFNEHNKAYKELHDNPKVCPICKKISSSKSVTEMHMKVHTKEKPFIPLNPFLCQTCGKAFKQDTWLKKHLKVCFKNVQLAEKTTIEVKCLECGVVFTSAELLRKHMRKHYQKYMFRCKFCSLIFNDLTSYQSHLNSAHEKRFVCHLCGKAYVISESLRVHLKSHKRIKQFKCKLCHKSFTALHFKYHIKKHLGPAVKFPVKSYSCTICNAKFKTNYLLNLHLKNKTHDGSYKCPYCNIFSKTKRIRTSHVKVHHPEFTKEYLLEIINNKKRLRQQQARQKKK